MKAQLSFLRLSEQHAFYEGLGTVFVSITGTRNLTSVRMTFTRVAG